jgi:hypothetical protein
LQFSSVHIPELVTSSGERYGHYNGMRPVTTSPSAGDAEGDSEVPAKRAGSCQVYGSRITRGPALLTDAIELDTDQNMLSPGEPAAMAEALAAVQRLSTLFADVSVPDLETMLNNPMLGLENSALLDSARSPKPSAISPIKLR